MAPDIFYNTLRRGQAEVAYLDRKAMRRPDDWGEQRKFLPRLFVSKLSFIINRRSRVSARHKMDIMQKRVKMLFSTNPHPNVIELVKELEEKGFIDGDTIVYDDKDESVIAALFDKYYVPIL